MNLVAGIQNQDIKSVKERIQWIDIYKGIAIITMVVAHAAGSRVPYIYIFHMAAFFFISGYTEKFEAKSLVDIVIAKMSSLLILFISVNMVFVLIRLVMNFTNLDRLYYDEVISVSNVYGYIKMLFQFNWTMDWGGATWFLVALFFAFIFSKLLVLITNNKVNLVTVLLSAGLLLFIYQVLTFKIHFGRFVDLGCIAAFYLILGSYCRVTQLFSKLRIKSTLLLFSATCLYLAIFGKVLHLIVDWPDRTFNIAFLDILSSVIAIIMIYNISIKLENTKTGSLLSYLGENSLGILVTHFFILRGIFTMAYIIGLTDVTILKRLIPPPNTVKTFIYSPLVLILFTWINNTYMDNKIYKIIILGKYKCKFSILEKQNYKKTANIICFILLILFIEPNIPYHNIVKAITQVNIESGIYEDNFSTDIIMGQIQTKGEGVIRIVCYVTEHTPNNIATISVNGTIIKIQPLNTGANSIDVQVDKYKRCEFRMDFSQTFVADEVSKNGDNRKLSVVINKIEGK